jgi:cytidylate kinase
MAILTISREYGSDGREIGRHVAQLLDYAYVDKEQLFQDLDQIGERWGRVARELDEVSPTLWERYDWQYRGYIAQVEAILLKYAAADRVVIVGRGGFFLLRQVPFCLKVRLVAPMEVRLERIMAQERMDHAAARKLIIREDQDRAGYVFANYETYWDDQSNYDLILNTGNFTEEQIVDILAAALQEKDIMATATARQNLADLSLAAQIKVRVATDPRISVPTLKVSPEAGRMVVAGVIHSPRELLLVQELVREAAGDRLVEFQLRHRG